MRRWAVVASVLLVPACGVTAQDEPQIIEERTQPPATATPSFETEPQPSSGGPTTSTTPPGPSTTPPG